jgi:hypothetical protein
VRRLAGAHLAATRVGESTLLWAAVPLLLAGAVRPLWPALPGVAAAYGAWRGLTVNVRETPDGLAVRGYAVTRRVAWRDVVSVAWESPWAGVTVPVVRVRGRRRGVRVRAMEGWRSPRSREDAATVRRWAQSRTS